MSKTITEVVDALSQRQIQVALGSLDAICADCPDHVCVHDPRACPVNDARRALASIFLEDWVEDEPPPSSGGGCSSGGCGVKF